MANSVNPDQMPHSVASDLGLHFLLRLSVQMQTEMCLGGWMVSAPNFRSQGPEFESH